jgi:hypothetical protein
MEITLVVKDYEEKMNKMENKAFKDLGTGLENKINELLAENYTLKNKSTLLES